MSVMEEVHRCQENMSENGPDKRRFVTILKNSSPSSSLITLMDPSVTEIHGVTRDEKSHVIKAMKVYKNDEGSKLYKVKKLDLTRASVKSVGIHFICQ